MSSVFSSEGPRREGVSWGQRLGALAALGALGAALAWWGLMGPGHDGATGHDHGVHGHFPALLGGAPAAGATGDEALTPTFEGADKGRAKISVALQRVGGPFPQPTGIHFVPGQPVLALITSQTGEIAWLNLESGASGPWATLKVATRSEQGLLGLAFHPTFSESGRFFINRVVGEGPGTTVIEEWRVPKGVPLVEAAPTRHRQILAVAQPYANHNAGDLEFGPDGMLYVPLGDGGAGGDPQGHGQRRETLLGSILRLDVDAPGVPYAVPPDNPFLPMKGAAPELWAFGLRNPWQITFAPDGRLIVADVGQDAWEEVNLVGRGQNLGWAVTEGTHCFRPAQGCDRQGLTEPIYSYSHDEGRSITGGRVYTGAAIPALSGLYVFGDFVTGRLWAIDLPKDGSAPTPRALGRRPIAPSTFGQDATGEVYLADFASGAVFKLVPAGGASPTPAAPPP